MNLICDTCPVRNQAACAVLTDEERDELARTGRHIKLKRGEVLFRAGDPEESCATLQSGALKVTSIDSEGNERILSLVHPAGFVGEMFRSFRDYDVVALSDCQICLFPKLEMERMLERFPSLSHALLKRAQEDLHASHDLLAMTGGGSAEEKVAALVLSLGRAASASPCHPANYFELPLTRGEMASMLGLTIETVSRKISELENAGAIKRKGTRGIELVDPALLHRSDPLYM